MTLHDWLKDTGLLTLVGAGVSGLAVASLRAWRRRRADRHVSDAHLAQTDALALAYLHLDAKGTQHQATERRTEHITRVRATREELRQWRKSRGDAL